MRGAIIIATTVNRHSGRFFFGRRGLSGCAAVFNTRARSLRLGTGIAISPSFTVGFFFCAINKNALKRMSGLTIP